MLESVVQRNILKHLEAEGCYVVKVLKANRAGTHDVLACIPIEITEEMVGKTVGVFASIEIKREQKEEMRRLQQYHDRKVKKAHGFTVKAYSVDVVKKFVEQIKTYLTNRAHDI